MKNWQATGAILTGVAALVTAGVGVYEKLKTVQQEIYKPFTAEDLPPSPKKEYALVDDKDGWVNLREQPNVSSPIIARISNGSNLEVLSKDGNWFKVCTDSGRKGYVFKDRLILVNNE